MSDFKKPSHIPIFPDAYLRDTYRLTTEEHGAYYLMMLEAWGQDDCTLPNDAKELAKITGMTTRRWSMIAPNILKFWTVDGSRIFQKRLRKEWNYVNEKRKKAASSAKARWQSDGDADAMRTHTERNANAMHLGGGGGGGGGDLTKGESFLKEGDVAPFKIVEGGK